MAITRADVNYVYSRFLGRNPDQADLENLVGQDIQKSNLIDTVKQSDEYKSLTPEDHINRQFQVALGRDASDTERERLLNNDEYFNFTPTTMGGREKPERLAFKSDLLGKDLAKLPEADLVRVYKNYLGRMPDEEAYRNYMRQFEAEPNKGPDVMGTQTRREQKLVDVNYDYAMPEKRLEEVGWSPEAQQYINNKFDAEARRYAEEKGIELPEDFSALAQLRNPYQDNRAGMEGLNLMTPVTYDEGPFGTAERPSTYDIYSESDLYDIPVSAMWFSKVGTAAFLNEEKAKQMVDLYSPKSAVDAYAKDPGDFLKQAAAGVYVNNWLEQNIDPGVTESGANKDKLAALGQRYVDISNRAKELGVDPDDIARATAQKVDKVAADYQTYYNDTHENTFMKFLLAAGATLLGAYGLSQVLGGAGATGAGSVSFGAGAGPTLGTGTYFSGATGLPGYVTGGTGAAATGTGGGFIGGGYGSIGLAGHTAGTAAGTGAATTPAITSSYWSGVQGLPGYAGSSAGAMPTAGEQLLGGGLKLPTVPGGAGSGAGGLKIPANQGLASNIGAKVGAGAEQIGTGMVGLKPVGFSMPTGGTSFIDKAKDVLGKAKDLTNIVSGGQQQQQQQPQGGLSRALTAAELYPQSNIMIPIEKYLELTTPRRTFLGGLGAMRNEA